MDNLLILFLVIVLFSTWFWLYKKTNKTLVSKQHEPSEVKIKSKYHGITIHQTSNACLSVKNIQGKRYLADEAPRLPIVGCSTMKCRCKYEDLDDRRSGEDRRYPSDAFNNMYSAEEHRLRKDRRKYSFA
mgnify:CR=1 FL=1